MSDIKLKYFGTDGVRGIANQTLTPELAFRLGRTGGTILTRHMTNDKNPVVIVGRDTRISGDMLQQAIVAGFLSVGIDVLRLGVISTPAVAFLVQDLEADAGVQITASHNPAADNGIKFFGNDGFKLSDELEYEIEQLLDADEDTLSRPSAEGLGVANNYPEGTLKYLEFLQRTIPNDLGGMRVALDGANGATSALLPRLFADLNTDFVTMGTEPNGLNINNGVGSTHPEALAELVKTSDVQVGLAFDGDGDRLIAVDENGSIVDGDKIMFIIGKFMNEQGRLKHNTIVSTVMSNIGFYKAVAAHGMTSVQTAVGDRYVMEEMIKSDYNLGGEQSGHIIFRDWATTGDGLLTALQLLYVMKETGTKLSELASDVEVYPQKLSNIPVADKVAIQRDPDVIAKIAEVESEMAGDGRVLVRASGTESLLRVMAEAPTEELVNQYVNDIVDVVRDKAGL
ncbi:phosphoglucosamine mutase [Leuconostoc carnosum]|uniref:phosphoglucosamine mutase n=1 Tax=Leuconostoc TaxID=1243 RepID=UPI000D51761F|nr:MULTISPECIES: phosphoglucosamine mutase [Leuconostoc]KAA8325959.1 phosphoglucosamine mutase [Leuconostoc carnosum]KAA8362242.1 phosphoglucosamine mutase [Leuconostoc carnosum]KAA8366791.1 phosphoglucosamine mutase [Leuconostoc carnosum]KAA8373171.1 phosphoglucosamine mutase [Leuconostoc carnosum]KAA8373798.1 phosphoglucosamine mutase [Leuconostoc carnosum]